MADFEVNAAYLEEVGGGKKSFQKNMLTNIRKLEADPTAGTQRELFNLSLVVPSDHSAEPTELGPTLDEDSTLYEWVRDFKVQIRSVNVEPYYVFAFSDKGSVFCPTRAAINLKRIGNKEEMVHDAVVKRRKLTKEEDKRMKHLEREISY